MCFSFGGASATSDFGAARFSPWATRFCLGLKALPTLSADPYYPPTDTPFPARRLL